jgi:hypothetical protein
MKSVIRTSICAGALVLTSSVSTVFAQTVTKLGEVPQFLKSVVYSVPGVTEAVLADVNGDGILDIVTANGFAGNATVAGGRGISILFGNGDGSFKAARTVLASGNPTAIAVGDFNGDGKPDIVVGFGAGATSLSILHGNGDGTFQAASPIPIGFLAKVSPAKNVSGVSSLVGSDFTGDGKLDLAVAVGALTTDPATGNVFEQYAVEVLINRGNGAFGAVDMLTENSTASPPSPLVVADFDADGHPDLISSDSTILLGNGDGTFRTIPSSSGTFGAFQANGVVGDFNGDGRLDIAGVIKTAQGGHIFPPPQSVIDFGAAGGNFSGPAISNWVSSVVSITNNGLTTNVRFNGDNWVAADFNADGKLDIAGFRDISYGLGNGQFNTTFNTYDFDSALGFPAVVGTVTPPQLVVAGDLDGDGAPDLIALGDGNSIQVALNTAGRAPKLAQLGLLDSPSSPNASQIAKSVVGGGGPTVTGEVSLGAPAPAGGAVITLVSSNTSVFFPAGNTLLIAAGSQFVDFPVATRSVSAPTLTTISATYRSVTLNTTLMVDPAFTLSSIVPVTLLGEFGGNGGVGTLTLSGPAADGTVVSLVSSNPAALTVPASVTVASGANSAAFPLTANHVAADTVVTITGKLAATSRSGAATVKAQPAIVTIQKAEYVVKKGQLTVQATSTNIEPVGSTSPPALKVFNAANGALVGAIRLANVGKGNVGLFTGVLTVSGSLTSIGVQDFAGGLAISAVAQK